MRALKLRWGRKFEYCFLLLLCSPQVLAFRSTADTRFEVNETQAPGGLFSAPSSGSDQGSVRSLKNSIGLKLEGLRLGLDLKASIGVDHPDYSSLGLRDERQREVKLEGRTESYGETSAQYSFGAHRLEIGYKGSLNSGPFASQAGSLGWNEGFYGGTTQAFFQTSYGVQDRPSNYFVDDDFRTHERPRLVHSTELSLGVEQVLSDRWKIRGRTLIGRRIEERPTRIGFEIIQGVAVSDRWFAKWKVKGDQEMRGAPLKDERGYFRGAQSQWELSFEPVYDFLISASYGVVIEQEDRPQNFGEGRITQVGSDFYGLGLSFPVRTVRADLGGSLMRTNRQTSGFSFTGGVSVSL